MASPPGKKMFLVLSRFAAGNARASDLLVGHNEWIKRGFEESVFRQAAFARA
jgi:hypothetical protein